MHMTDELKKLLPVLNPPYNGKLVRLNRFYDIDKGKLVEITIAQEPEDLSKMIDWMKYRENIGKPIHIGLRHVNCMKCKMIEIKLHDEHSPLWIEPYFFDVYIDADKHHKMSKHDAVAWRYILYYCGYRLKKKRVKGAWFGDRKKHKQMQLSIK